MNTLALVLLGIAVVNPPRVRLLLGARTSAVRSRAAAGGAAVALLVAVGLAAIAGQLIDALDVSPETFRIAAALVITLGGVLTVAYGGSTPEALSGERRDALIPVAYPILLGPAQVLTWLVLGVDRGIAPTLGVAAAGYVSAALLAGAPEGRRSGWVAAARLVATVVVVLGVALVIDGVREV